MTRLALVAVVALAAVLRAWPWLRPHALGGVLEYDDGVYYASARALLAGQVPYRDVTIVHPPLVPVVLAPFALVGQLAGDQVGLVAARVAVLVAGCASTALVFAVVRRLVAPVAGRAASAGALLGAAAYAVHPGAVTAEHTVLLEPLVTLASLVALLLLARAPAPSTWRCVVVGVLLAVATSIKVFGAAQLLAVVWGLLVQRRPRPAATVAAAWAGTGLLVVAPLLALGAGGDLLHDVVRTQLLRPPGGATPGRRLVDLAGLTGVTSRLAGSATPVRLALTLLVAVAVLLSLRRSPLSTYTAGAAVTTLALVRAPSYFPHYAAALAPDLAVLLGCGAARVLALRSARLLAPALAVLLGALAYGGARAAVVPSAQADLRAAAARTLPAGSCVWSDAVSLLVSADRFRVSSPDCPSWLDGRGVALATTTFRGDDYYPRGFVLNEPWQQETRAQLAHADGLLVRTSPLTLAEWSATTRTYVAQHFRPVRSGAGAASWEIWVRDGA